MGVTQYTGARYVPLFAEPAEWNNTRTYEPLTIVIHEGNSYTSRQYVPKGIDIANEKFWALTGNYNAQVEQYRKDVLLYDNRITVANNTANTALSNTTTNKNSIDTLNNEMAGTSDSGLKTLISNEATARTDAINNEVTARTDAINNEKNTRLGKNRKILWIGDSFSAELHHGKNGDWSPVGKLVDYYHMNITNVSVDGAGFYANKSKNIDFKSQAASVSDKDTYTDIVVYGNHNDHWQDSAAVGTAIEEFWVYVNNNFPNAEQWLFCSNLPQVANRTGTYQCVYRTSLRTPRCHIFSNVNAVQLLLNGVQSTTNAHPTSVCGNYLADYFYRALNFATPTLTYSYGWTAGENVTFASKTSIQGDLHGLSFPGLTIKATADLSNGAILGTTDAFVNTEFYNVYSYSYQPASNGTVQMQPSTVDTTIFDGTAGKKGILILKLYGSLSANQTIYLPGIYIPWGNNAII